MLIILREDSYKTTSIRMLSEMPEKIGETEYAVYENLGGEGGIRTLDRVAPVPPFQGGDLNHSSTSPVWRRDYSASIACYQTGMQRIFM